MPRPLSFVPVTAETLENRRLFAGIAFSHHVLVLAGSHIAPDTITYGLTADGSAVEATVSYPGNGSTKVFTKTVPLSDDIKLISVIGGNGDDLVTVDQTYGSFSIKSVINVGAGDDTVHAGEEPDRINGGAGDDLLDAGGGNNTVYGGTGNDTLMAGSGNDYLNGGVGHDVVYGGDGNDTLADSTGPNTLLGGSGNNVFVIANVTNNTTDYVKGQDRIILVNPNSNSDTGSSILSDLFPISSFL
jgi:Ca2+-binding RTX toxin-like protein